MKIDKLLYLEVKIDEKEVQAGDLSTLIYFVDELSKAIAVNEALDLLEFFKFPVTDKFRIVNDYDKYGDIPAKLEDLEKGSAKIVLVISSGLLMWGLTTFLAKPIEAAWDSSSKRDALVNYVRNQFFGGAVKTVNQKLSKIKRKKNLIVSDVKVHQSHDQIDKIDVTLRRSEIQSIEPTDDELIDEFAKRLK